MGPTLWYSMFWLQMIAHFICCSSKPCESISAEYISILYAHSLPTLVFDHLHTNIHEHVEIVRNKSYHYVGCFTFRNKSHNRGRGYSNRLYSDQRCTPLELVVARPVPTILVFFIANLHHLLTSHIVRHILPPSSPLFGCRCIGFHLPSSFIYRIQLGRK